MVSGLDLSTLHSPGALAARLLEEFAVVPPLAVDGLDDLELDAQCATLHGGWVDATPTLAPTAAVDFDGRSFYPTVAAGFGWLDLIGVPLAVEHPTVEFAALARSVAESAGVLDFTTVKRLLVDPRVLRSWACTRVVVRADAPPYPSLPVELHALGAQGRLVRRPIRTLDGTTVDVTAGDYLAAVIADSAEHRRPIVPTAVDVVRLRPGDRPEPLRPVRLLRHRIDPNLEDPVAALVHLREALVASAERHSGHVRLPTGEDPRRDVYLSRAADDRRRARTLRVVANAFCYGQLARFDPTTNGDWKPGPWCAPWVAATITGYARMLLGIVHADAHARSGVVLSIDTDGMLVGSSPCGGEPIITATGSVFRALAWDELDEALSGFESLALTDSGVWKVQRTYEDRLLFARSFGPKRYTIGLFEEPAHV
jgi:hypothetical protein